MTACLAVAFQDTKCVTITFRSSRDSVKANQELKNIFEWMNEFEWNWAFKTSTHRTPVLPIGPFCLLRLRRAPCTMTKNACRSAISAWGFSYITSPIRQRVCTCRFYKIWGTSENPQKKFSKLFKRENQTLACGGQIFFSKILTVRQTENDSRL